MNKKGDVQMKKNADGSEEFSGKVYQGPFLPPDMLKEYKEADPQLPGRLMKWTEDETKHRRWCEKAFMIFNLIMNLSSHVCAVLVTGGILYVAYQFMKTNHAREGMWIALSIASVVGIFIIRRYMTSGSRNSPPSDRPPQKPNNNGKK